jgi:branched-chain amino acid aminotransferase
VSERPYTIHDVIRAGSEGRLLEAFGAGTAAIVSPVSAINFRGQVPDTPVRSKRGEAHADWGVGQEFKIPLDPKDPAAQAGPMARRVMSTLLSIQYGEVPHPWSLPVA